MLIELVRPFFACPLSRDDPQRCKYFKWADEVGTVAPTPQTPSAFPRQGGRQLQTPPRTSEIDWSKVDTERLEQEALSTPGSSQQTSITPIGDRLASASKRKIDDDQVTPQKRAQLDPNVSRASLDLFDIDRRAHLSLLPCILPSRHPRITLKKYPSIYIARTAVYELEMRPRRVSEGRLRV